MRNHVEVVLEWLVSGLGPVFARPWTLWCAVLAVNALALPYLGLYHDSRLYAAQLANNLGLTDLREDLYLEYGSQDRYSIFSLLLTPLVRVLGLSPAFFLGYLLSKAVLFWGALRLAGKLLADPLAVGLTGLYLGLAPVPFGGNEVFHINEAFLTPRLLACGLVLWGLARLLERRWLTAILLELLALLIHPLMGVAGVLSLGLWAASTLLSGRLFLSLLLTGIGLATATVVVEPLGRALFGHMDEEWRDIYFQMCFFIDPFLWWTADWVRLSVGFATVATAVFLLPGDRGRLVAALLAVGLCGLVSQVITVRSSYHLLLQASPYRAMWLSEWAVVPLLFGAAAHLWKRGDDLARATAVAVFLLATTCPNSDPLPFWLLVPLLLPIGFVLFRGLGRIPRDPHWIADVALMTGLVVLVLLSVFDLLKVGLMVNRLFRYEPDHPHDTFLMLGTATQLLFKLPLLVLALVVLRELAFRLGNGAGLCITLLGVALVYQLGLSVGPSLPGARQALIQDAERLQCIGNFLKAHARPDRNLTVYANCLDIHHLWFDYQVQSFFNWFQMSGCVFNRGTAIEGYRRARHVRVFEAAVYRKSPHPSEDWKRAWVTLYRIQAEEPEPTEDDLFALCADTKIDYVVLSQPFEGLYEASCGNAYLYDCRKLRELAQ